MSISGSDLYKSFNSTDLDQLYKIDYKKYYDETFNTQTPVWNKIKKTNDATGKKAEFPAPLGYTGGVGSGSLPEATLADYGDCQVLYKKIYATAKIDRFSIMASKNDKGAFVKLLTENAKKTVQADVWNHNRMLFGNGDGSLGTLKASGAVTDNTGGNYSIIIGEAASSFKEANFEENMLVNFASGTDKFEIQTVTPSTRTIVVQRQAGGTDVPADGNVCYLQGSKDNDIHGLKQILDLASSTAYNVTVGRRWKAYNELLNYAAALTVEVMNKAMIGVEKQSGTVPNMIVTSYAQYEKILNFLEDKKRFSLVDAPAKGKPTLSYSGVKFQSSRGAIDIFPDKFCDDDRMYFLNTDHIVYMRLPESGWVKDDIGGNGYLRAVGEDAFEARYATYGNIFIAPPFHAVVSGLTV